MTAKAGKKPASGLYVAVSLLACLLLFADALQARGEPLGNLIVMVAAVVLARQASRVRAVAMATFAFAMPPLLDWAVTGLGGWGANPGVILAIFLWGGWILLKLRHEGRKARWSLLWLLPAYICALGIVTVLFMYPIRID
jgi:hypothetical protein